MLGRDSCDPCAEMRRGGMGDNNGAVNRSRWSQVKFELPLVSGHSGTISLDEHPFVRQVKDFAGNGFGSSDELSCSFD